MVTSVSSANERDIEGRDARIWEESCGVSRSNAENEVHRWLHTCFRLVPFDPSQETIVDQGSSDAPSVAGNVSI